MVSNLHEKADGLSRMVSNLHEKSDGLSGMNTDLSLKDDSLARMITNISEKADSLLERIDKLNQQITYPEYKDMLVKINKKIQNDNEQGIIPIIIDCEHPIFNHFLEPVIRELYKLPEHKFDIFFGELIKSDGASYFYYNEENAFPISIYSKIAGNMVFLSPNSHAKGPISALKIVFGHGILSTKISFLTKDEYEDFNIYCISGKLSEIRLHKILEKYGLKNKVEVITGGYPKLDILFQGTHPSKNEIFTRLNLDSSKKTLLYAPSWDKGLSLREFGLSIIETILQNKDYNLIVKLHPNSFRSTDDNNYMFYTGGKNWKDQFRSFFKNSNFRFMQDYNIVELLIISDIMITDISSVALEFLVLDKPVIYLDCPRFEETLKELYYHYNNYSYNELIENPYCNAGRHVGLVNYDHKKILEDVSFLIKNPDYKINERKEYSGQILSNKGHASEFYANMIITKFNEFIQ
jgi:CDP-glycerol glycerophosphotransferase (TagB/SpsB family)